MSLSEAPLPIKPRLRGVLHQEASLLAFGACTVLVTVAPTQRAMLAASIYGVCMVLMFAVSASYHRPNWAAGTKQLFRRLDHAGIYLMIAGSYTPVVMLAAPDLAGDQLLAWVWAGAGLGVARALFWPHSPRVVTVASYLILGWIAGAYLPAIAGGLGPTSTVALLLEALAYSVGAAVYGLKRPDPNPRWFGYHEVFHALVFLGALCHFTVVLPLVMRG